MIKKKSLLQRSVIKKKRITVLRKERAKDKHGEFKTAVEYKEEVVHHFMPGSDSLSVLPLCFVLTLACLEQNMQCQKAVIGVAELYVYIFLIYRHILISPVCFC